MSLRVTSQSSYPFNARAVFIAIIFNIVFYGLLAAYLYKVCFFSSPCFAFIILESFGINSILVPSLLLISWGIHPQLLTETLPSHPTCNMPQPTKNWSSNSCASLQHWIVCVLKRPLKFWWCSCEDCEECTKTINHCHVRIHCIVSDDTHQINGLLWILPCQVWIVLNRLNQRSVSSVLNHDITLQARVKNIFPCSASFSLFHGSILHDTSCTCISAALRHQ